MVLSPSQAADRGLLELGINAERIARLADTFLAARARDPRLHLLLAGGGPEEAALRERLGRAATFLGWLEGAELATAYASADLFLFCSQTDTFGQVVLEAQASGLPVVAVAAGGPAAGWVRSPTAPGTPASNGSDPGGLARSRSDLDALI